MLSETIIQHLNSYAEPSVSWILFEFIPWDWKIVKRLRGGKGQLVLRAGFRFANNRISQDEFMSCSMILESRNRE